MGLQAAGKQLCCLRDCGALLENRKNFNDVFNDTSLPIWGKSSQTNLMPQALESRISIYLLILGNKKP